MQHGLDEWMHVATLEHPPRTPHTHGGHTFRRCRVKGGDSARAAGNSHAWPMHLRMHRGRSGGLGDCQRAPHRVALHTANASAVCLLRCSFEGAAYTSLAWAGGHTHAARWHPSCKLRDALHICHTCSQRPRSYKSVAMPSRSISQLTEQQCMWARRATTSSLAKG